MSNQPDNNEEHLNISKPLGDIGKVLADAIKDQPFVASIILIFVIVTLGSIGFAIVLKSDILIFLFFLFAIFVTIMIYRMFKNQVDKQKEKILLSGELNEDFRTSVNTVELIDKLSVTQIDNIRTALGGAANDIAQTLNLPSDIVRANLFGIDDTNRALIIKELTHNMTYADEFTISMPVGYGSTGRCFSSGKPNIAIFREGWGKDAIEDQELRKVHPDLQWIISVPILVTGNGLKVIWVMNVDGLRERRNEEELKNELSRLFYWSQLIISIVSDTQQS